jgi:hypothetical protein
MNQVDIHIIDSTKYPANHQAQKQRLAHPRVNVQEALYVEGSVIEARYQAFQLGSAPYVSWVDDDDQVLDVQWIDQALEMLDADPALSAVFPQWCMSQDGVLQHTSMEGREPYPIAPHHLTIMRRENVLSLLSEVRDQFPSLICFAELMLVFGQLRFGKVVYLPALAYEWKQRSGGASSHTEDPYTTAFVFGHIQESLTHL